jgi:hypothetical protein
MTDVARQTPHLPNRNSIKLLPVDYCYSSLHFSHPDIGIIYAQIIPRETPGHNPIRKCLKALSLSGHCTLSASRLLMKVHRHIFISRYRRYWYRTTWTRPDFVDRRKDLSVINLSGWRHLPKCEWSLSQAYMINLCICSRLSMQWTPQSALSFVRKVAFW